MRIAVVIYDKFSLLNLANICEKLYEMSECEVKICSLNESVKDKFGFFVKPDIYSQSLDGFDGIVLTDGNNENIIYDEIFLSWIRSGFFAKTKISFGKGREIFARAGFENFTNLDKFDESKFTQTLTF